MAYLTIIFLSPVYFVVRSKWGAFVLNAVLFGLAWLCLLSVVGAFIAPVFWALAVGHAGWHLRTEIMAEQADLIAIKMAERLGQGTQQSSFSSEGKTAGDL